MLIAGTLLAWAVGLRLISDALFAALSAYMSLWGSVALKILYMLGLYQPEPLPQLTQYPHEDQLEYYQHHHHPHHHNHQKQQANTFMTHAMTFEEQHSDDHVHSWVQSAAMHAAECSPPASTCPSITSPPIAHSREPTSLESSSNGSSGSAAETIGRAVAASCALKMWREGEGDVQDKLQSVASIAAAVLLANRMSEPGATIKARRVSTGVCPPPLEYEASEELQQELEAAAPDEFMCPIGRVLMVDPVFTPSGFTYHRPCIMSYIQRTGRDPAHDATPLCPSQLCTNVNLRDQIATWLQRQGVQT